MIVVEYLSTDGRQVEEVATVQEAEAREISLRVRGTRHVVWYQIDEGTAA